MGPNLLTLIFILLPLSFNLSYSQGPPSHCNPHDKKALLRIKKYWGNPSSLDHWDRNVDCCQWDLIECNEHGHVQSLGIDSAPDVHGSLPPYLDQLPWLTELQFANMLNLTKPIPSYIGKLTNLTALKISDTSIAGGIPNFLAKLINLVHLDLSRNNHIGPIPDFAGRLKNLTMISFIYNQLSGPIPSSIAQLQNLTVLYLSNNKLSGRIPDFSTRNLNSLDLSGNQFSGQIPESIGLLPKLTVLVLENNRLDGMIPKTLGGTNVNSMSLENNKLTGDASFLFSKNNTALNYINVGNNRLKFDFSKVRLPRNIVYLYINHNMIYGSLPLGVGLLHPANFDVSYNRLCGPIPNGRRFKKVKIDIFAHNACLCGGPFRACK